MPIERDTPVAEQGASIEECPVSMPRRHASWRMTLALLSFATLLIGCDSSAPSKRITPRTIAVEALPSEILEAAQKALPGVSFSEAWRNVDANGTLQSYEIKGVIPATGKIREVRLSPTGEVLEKE